LEQKGAVIAGFSEMDVKNASSCARLGCLDVPAKKKLMVQKNL